ncbi:RNA-directed DNA polymerase, eukaryota [Tanacetum coccineum]
MGVRGPYSHRSKEDHVTQISKSIFVTNFPENFVTRDLWKLCEGYGKIGRLHLHANVVRYERSRKPSNSAGHVHVNMHAPSGSYATVVKGNTQSNTPVTPPSTIPALVLDDSCVIERDLSRYVMGRVKQLNSIPNLRTILTKKGFPKVKLTYLGGMWVMIELDNEVTKQKMLQHIGVKSWFQVLQTAKQDFVSDEHVVWVDIKGFPLNVWTRETFLKIDDSDVKGVSETNFGDKPSSPNNNVCKRNEKVVEKHSEDPYNIYDLLKQNPKGDTQDSNTTFSHPPGFTPEVMSTSQEVHENVTSKGESAFHSTHNSQMGGSILEVIDGLGHKTKNKWVKELNINHKVNFIALQETKIDRVTQMDVKFIWGNSNYQYVSSDSVGSSGGILCVWEATVFKKDYATVSDNFIAIYETWISINTKNGETIVMGDFNEVRSKEERLGSIYNHSSSRHFNQFSTSSGLVNVNLEGYSFTWSHPSATKMSKLDRFLISEDTNGLIRFKKKLHDLKKIIRSWVKDKKTQQSGAISSIKNELIAIDKNLDSGNASDVILFKRMELMQQLHDIKQMEVRDNI